MNNPEDLAMTIANHLGVHNDEEMVQIIAQWLEGYDYRGESPYEMANLLIKNAGPYL